MAVRWNARGAIKVVTKRTPQRRLSIKNNMDRLHLALAVKEVGRFVAEQLGARLLSDCLVWREMPEHRQGELLNNDQRRANVEGKLSYRPEVARAIEGDVLLLDDYFGSRATSK